MERCRRKMLACRNKMTQMRQVAFCCAFRHCAVGRRRRHENARAVFTNGVEQLVWCTGRKENRACAEAQRKHQMAAETKGEGHRRAAEKAIVGAHAEN